MSWEKIIKKPLEGDKYSKNPKLEGGYMEDSFGPPSTVEKYNIKEDIRNAESLLKQVVKKLGMIGGPHTEYFNEQLKIKSDGKSDAVENFIEIFEEIVRKYEWELMDN
tara:strand:- start:1728 stop:2051 length:324 start_codon:yes stop_codon:yes gene_type:complete